MPRIHMGMMVLFLGFVVFDPIWVRPLYGQPSKMGLSPEDQKKYDELVGSARRYESIGYIAGGAALLMVLAAIPLGIYFDRRKQALQKAQEEKASSPQRLKKPKP